MLGLNALMPRLRSVSTGTHLVLTHLVPFAAVVSAGALNVFVMRGNLSSNTDDRTPRVRFYSK